MVLGRRSHLMDFSWIIASLVAIGLVSLKPLLRDYYQVTKYLKVIYLMVIILVLYNLVLADHVYWSKAYDSTKYLEIKYLADKVNNYPTKIDDSNVIAVANSGLHPSLNYLSNKSVVLFNPVTIAKLINNGGLQKAFDDFGVNYIIGYDQELSKSIIKNSDVINISNWPDKQDLQIPLNYNKSWLLNLVK